MASVDWNWNFARRDMVPDESGLNATRRIADQVFRSMYGDPVAPSAPASLNSRPSEFDVVGRRMQPKRPIQEFGPGSSLEWMSDFFGMSG